MADVHSKETRSYNMSKIRSKDTKPEMIVRKFLHSSGYRYRLHSRNLPGKPDLILPKYRTVIFIHGCFWHGHEGCRYFVLPKSRTEFWSQKIKGTQERDKRAIDKLISDNWRIIVIWECELKPKLREKRLKNLVNELKK